MREGVAVLDPALSMAHSNRCYKSKEKDITDYNKVLLLKTRKKCSYYSKIVYTLEIYYTFEFTHYTARAKYLDDLKQNCMTEI